MAKKKQARHASALKAHRQSKRRNERNRSRRKLVREAAKAVLAAAASKDQTKADKLLAEAMSAIDKAAKNGTIHWKAAARKKSRLARRSASSFSSAK